ncbi:MAG TPA: Mur ligase domain-containing protein, partial [Chthoniobacterales bacterium]
MKQLPRHLHFLGICGTAMGAVAVALSERGCIVTGSDEKVYPPMSDFLRAKGIALHQPFAAEN